VRSAAGWWTTPSTGRAPTASPIITDQPRSPRMKSLVPSIGSTYHTRAAVSRRGSSSVSSQMMTSSGNALPSASTRNADDFLSAIVTGSLPAFISTPRSPRTASTISPARTASSRASASSRE
jgi:hypothetical protein